IDFGQGAQLRMRTENQIDPRRGPLQLVRPPVSPMPALARRTLLLRKCRRCLRPRPRFSASGLWKRSVFQPTRPSWRRDISLVPPMAVRRSPDLKFVRIADAEATRTIGALTLRGRSLSRAYQAFLSRSSRFPPSTRQDSWPQQGAHGFG